MFIAVHFKIKINLYLALFLSMEAWHFPDIFVYGTVLLINFKCEGLDEGMDKFCAFASNLLLIY